MSSSKNILQEKFQKHYNKPPIYETKKCGGSDHEPTFVTNVTLPSGIQISGAISKTKKEAEKSAAEAALFLVNQGEIIFEEKHNIAKLSSKIPSLVLIDLENVSQEINTITRGENVTIKAYVTKNHHFANKKDLPYNLEVVQQVLPDAVDTKIICDCCMGMGEYKQIVVVTRDHYGDCLVGLFPGVVKQCTSIAELKKMFA